MSSSLVYRLSVAAVDFLEKPFPLLFQAFELGLLGRDFLRLGFLLGLEPGGFGFGGRLLSGCLGFRFGFGHGVGFAFLLSFLVDQGFLGFRELAGEAFDLCLGLYDRSVIFANLSIAFSSAKTKNGFDRFGMIQDFLVGIGLTVYLIYIIPDSSLQTIVTAIVSAVYGGLITLVGVAWTIKKSDKDRKSDELLKAKPIFSFNPQLKGGLIDDSTKACFTPIDFADGFSCEAHVEIENSNKSSFCLNKIFHDGKWFHIEGNKILLPSGKCYFVFDFSDALDIVLSVNDSLNNEYLYVLRVLMMTPITGIGGGFTSNHKIFHTLREIEEISKDDFDKLITSKQSKESGKDGAK